MLAEIGVPLESKIFRRNKNGSVLQSRVEHINKVLLLNQSNKVIANKSTLIQWALNIMLVSVDSFSSHVICEIYIHSM
jgi:hypothetical protein